MLTLLQIEWLKIRKYKPVWIIFIFLMLLCPAVTIGVGKFMMNITSGSQAMKIFLGNPFDFNLVFETAAYINNGLNIAWGMLLILMIGNEFQNRTIRQNVIDGQKRNDIITSKILLVGIFSLASATLVIISGFIAGFFYSDTSIKFDEVMAKTFGVSVFAAFMQMLFALVFAFLVKRPAFAMILYLIYTVFIENVLVQILVVATNTYYPKLILTQAADELIKFPLSRSIPIDGGLSLPSTAVWIACLVYIVVILIFLYRKINRMILK